MRTFPRQSDVCCCRGRYEVLNISLPPSFSGWIRTGRAAMASMCRYSHSLLRHRGNAPLFFPCGHLDFEPAVTAQNDEFKVFKARFTLVKHQN